MSRFDLIEGGVFSNFVRKNKGRIDVRLLFLFLQTMPIDNLINDLKLSEDDMPYNEWKEHMEFVFMTLFDKKHLNNTEAIYGMTLDRLKQYIYQKTRNSSLFEICVEQNGGILLYVDNFSPNSIINNLQVSHLFADKQKYQNYLKTTFLSMFSEKPSKGFWSEVFKVSVVSGHFRISRVMLEIYLEQKSKNLFYQTQDIFKYMEDDMELFRLYCKCLNPRNNVHWKQILMFCIETQHIDKLRIVMDYWYLQVSHFEAILILSKIIKAGDRALLEVYLDFKARRTILLLEKANQGDFLSQEKIILILINQQKYAEALAAIQKYIEQGNVEVISILALLYINGWGVDKDLEKANQLYQEAADKGSIRALFHFSKENRKNLELSAEKGYAEAQYRLAKLYHDEQNIDKARLWAKRAAFQDHLNAQLLYIKCESTKTQLLFWAKYWAFNNPDYVYRIRNALIDYYKTKSPDKVRENFWTSILQPNELDDIALTPDMDEYWFRFMLKHKEEKDVKKYITCIFGQTQFYNDFINVIKEADSFKLFVCAKYTIQNDQKAMLKLLLDNNLLDKIRVFDFAYDQNFDKMLLIVVSKLNWTTLNPIKLTKCAFIAWKQQNRVLFDKIANYVGKDNLTKSLLNASTDQNVVLQLLLDTNLLDVNKAFEIAYNRNLEEMLLLTVRKLDWRTLTQDKLIRSAFIALKHENTNLFEQIKVFVANERLIPAFEEFTRDLIKQCYGNNTGGYSGLFLIMRSDFFIHTIMPRKQLIENIQLFLDYLAIESNEFIFALLRIRVIVDSMPSEFLKKLGRNAFIKSNDVIKTIRSILKERKTKEKQSEFKKLKEPMNLVGFKF